ncbi:MAG: ribonuclease HIII [uncultured bacterium]|nr:MAG: ribonuclease HIII [uncultured bacterium]
MNHFSANIKEPDIVKLKHDLKQKSFEFKELPYGHFQAINSSLKITINVYHSLKCLIQGKGTEEFVRYYFEPEILKTFDLDYGHLNFKEKIGMDESGKGDYFGPLVVASAYVSNENFHQLKKNGVVDSKKINDKRIHVIAETIKKICPIHFISISPEKYNELYAKFNNLNSLLAWAHSACLKEILTKCNTTNATIDKFAQSAVLNKYLKIKNITIDVEQIVRGEQDIAVAAASIIARSNFLNQIENLSKKYGIQLPKGGGESTHSAGKEFIAKHGIENLGKVAKLHFKNTEKIQN